jgi:hypothetical protein
MTAPKAADLFAAPAGSGTFDLLRSARATIDLFPGLPDLTAFHEAPGFAPNAPYWPSSLPPTWHTAIRAGHSPSG